MAGDLIPYGFQGYQAWAAAQGTGALIAMGAAGLGILAEGPSGIISADATNYQMFVQPSADADSTIRFSRTHFPHSLGDLVRNGRNMYQRLIRFTRTPGPEQPSTATALQNQAALASRIRQANTHPQLRRTNANNVRNDRIEDTGYERDSKYGELPVKKRCYINNSAVCRPNLPVLGSKTKYWDEQDTNFTAPVNIPIAGWIEHVNEVPQGANQTSRTGNALRCLGLQLSCYVQQHYTPPNGSDIQGIVGLTLLWDKQVNQVLPTLDFIFDNTVAGQQFPFNMVKQELRTRFKVLWNLQVNLVGSSDMAGAGYNQLRGGAGKLIDRMIFFNPKAHDTDFITRFTIADTTGSIIRTINGGLYLIARRATSGGLDSNHVTEFAWMKTRLMFVDCLP